MDEKLWSMLEEVIMMSVWGGNLWVIKMVEHMKMNTEGQEQVYFLKINP